MADKKILAVLGATGAQGGGLVRAILSDADGGFAARALTRNPQSDPARALADAGAEVVAADLDDPQSLKQAFAGAHGVYGVTNFWEHFSPEKEMAQARAIAQATRHAAVKHVIWSTLEDTRERVPLDDDRLPTLQGAYKVPHLDSKGASNRFFTEEGVPVTFFHTSFYWDNLIHFGMGPKPGPDGMLAFTMPMDDKKLPGIAASDIGACAYGIFLRGDQLVGKSVGVAGEHLTGSEMADSLSKALGRPVRYNAVPADVYRSFDFPGAEDLGNMFAYKALFEKEYCGARSVEFSRSLYPGLRTFDQWLKDHAKDIPLD
jgi:uncharacterized protein YbjT (DUF2867 family)